MNGQVVQQQQQQQQQQHDGENQYTVIIRVSDKSSRFIDAPWKIIISGHVPQTFYKIALELETLQELQPLFIEQYHIANFINLFFKGNLMF